MLNLICIYKILFNELKSVALITLDFDLLFKIFDYSITLDIEKITSPVKERYFLTILHISDLTSLHPKLTLGGPFRPVKGMDAKLLQLHVTIV